MIQQRNIALCIVLSIVRSCRKLTAQSKLSEKLEKSRFLHFKFEQ